MKKYIIAVCLSLLAIAASAQKTPSWLKSRPVEEGKYIGIGMAPLSDPDHRNKAVTNAMMDIAAQVSINISASTFMQTLDVDGRSRDLFEEKVQSKVASNISGHVLKDTYQSDNHYYVYYELDKKKYEKFIEGEKKKGTSIGLDYYAKGRQAEASNSYVNAVKLYAKGLEAIEPYLYLDLTVKYDGKKIDLPTELYNACIGVFGGLELVQNVTEIPVEAFKPSPEPLAVCLSKGGMVIPNVAMTAQFTTGDGALTADMKTDATGTAVFYITNVTSKSAIQTVDVRMDEAFISELPESYRVLIDRSSFPTATFTLVLTSKSFSACYTVSGNAVPTCDAQIRALLVNNNFDLTDNTSAALFITLSTDMKQGALVQGELYNMYEYFTSLNLRIYDNLNDKELLNYNIAPVRVLVPADNSKQQIESACARELMKRVNVQLPQAIKKLNINL
jgi:hypothetical protein